MPLDVQQAIDASEQATLRALTVMNSRPPVDPGRNMPPVKGSANGFVWALVAGFFSLLWWLIKFACCNPCMGMLLSIFVYRIAEYLCDMHVPGACGVKGLMDSVVVLFVANLFVKAGGLLSGNAHHASKEASKQQVEPEAMEDPAAFKTCCDDVLSKATAGLSEAQKEHVKSITQAAFAQARVRSRNDLERVKEAIDSFVASRMTSIENQNADRLNSIEGSFTGRLKTVEDKYICWMTSLSSGLMFVSGLLCILWLRVMDHIGDFVKLGTRVTRQQTENAETARGFDERLTAFDGRLNGHDTELKRLSEQFVLLTPACASGRSGRSSSPPIACGGPGQ